MRETFGAAMLLRGTRLIVDHRVVLFVDGHDFALTAQAANERAFGFGGGRQIGFATGHDQARGDEQNQMKERFHLAVDSGRGEK